MSAWSRGRLAEGLRGERAVGLDRLVDLPAAPVERASARRARSGSSPAPRAWSSLSAFSASAYWPSSSRESAAKYLARTPAAAEAMAALDALEGGGGRLVLLFRGREHLARRPLAAGRQLGRHGRLERRERLAQRAVRLSQPLVAKVRERSTAPGQNHEHSAPMRSSVAVPHRPGHGVLEAAG